MFDYKEIITTRAHLNAALRNYQQHGWELVSHAICSNNNISVIIRKEQNKE